MPIGKDGEIPGGMQSARCADCGATHTHSQRYCLECGIRLGSLPPAFARWLSVARPVSEEGGGADDAPPAHGEEVAEEALEDTTLAERYMPEPRSAAIAVMALLAFGVVVGAATGPIAQSAGISPLIVEMGPSPAASSEEPAEEPAEEGFTEAAPTAPEAVPSALPPAPPEEPPPTTPAKPIPPEEFPEEPGLPAVEHVFMIVLGDHGFEEGFGASSPAPYLAKTLRAKGELLSNYYAVTHGDLANEIALLSGQGPTQATASGCPSYADISPGAVGGEEQVAGEGCVYPSATQTLPGQLVAAKKSWKVYSEDAEGTSPEPVAACGPFATARNPFVYFHSLTDSPECAEHNAGLSQLETDLVSPKTTPALSYIVPNACHDGGDQPCETGGAAGLADTQPFLEKIVPQIEASMAYKKGGLIAITFAQAPQTGPSVDSSACCATPEYPNLPPSGATPAASGPVKPSGGGGRVGLLLISPFIEAGSSNEAGYYNHFSLLLSIEEAFHLTPIGYAANPALSAFDGSVYNQAF